MLSSASQLRQKGADDLKGRWGEAALFFFVYVITTAACSGIFGSLVPFLGGIIVGWLLLPLGWGVGMAFLANHRKEDNDPFNLSHFMDGYRDFSRIFLTLLLRYIYTLLWCLLFIIPGIIKSLSYAMTPYILRDHPEMKNNAAIELSMDMMEGHKADLFWLQLTFIGWWILCIFTLGIGFFWLTPYISSTNANFYEEVKAEYEGRPIEKPTDLGESTYNKSER